MTVLVRVGQKREPERVAPGEFLVAGETLRADPPHDGVEVGELRQLRGVRTHLLRTDRGVVARVEREHHRVPALGREALVVAAGDAGDDRHRRQREIGRGNADLGRLGHLCPH